jgi:hypothetical protein
MTFYSLLGNIKFGDLVISKKRPTNKVGLVLNHLDPRAWREQKSKNTIFPWSESWGSDLSHGRTIPTNEHKIKNKFFSLVLLGELNPKTYVPILWNFGKIYWEEKKNLRKRYKNDKQIYFDSIQKTMY